MSRLKLYILVVLVYFFTASYITFPLIFNLGSSATSVRDEFLISWIQDTVVNNLFTNPLHLFDGNIFYPYQNVLAYSDLHLTSAVLSFLPAKVTGQAITTINFTLLSSLVLLAFAAFLLSYYLTRDVLLSLLSGFLIQFSPTTLDKNVHVQILAVEWVLFAILFLFLFLKTRKYYFFFFSVVFFLLQTINSFLPGYFVLFSYCITISVFCLRENRSLFFYFQKKHILTLLAALVTVLVIGLPYFEVSKQFAYVRDIREAVHLSLQPEDFYYPNDLTRLQPVLRAISSQSSFPPFTEFKVGYLGAVFSALSLLTIVYCIKERKKIQQEHLSLFLIGVFGLVLSFGPVLHLGRKTIHDPTIIPLPYSILYYVIPGFQGLRAAYRWEMLFVICFAVCSVVVLSRLLKGLSKLRRNVIAVVLSILVIGEFHYPMHFENVPQTKSFPRAYEYLRALPKNTKIVEMPIYNWNMFPYSSIELKRVYFSTYHKKTMINGASGFSPPPWQEMVRELFVSFPSEESLRKLKSLGVEYIVVHKDEYDRLSKDSYAVNNRKVRDGDAIVSALKTAEEVALVKQLGEDVIFALK